MDNSDIREKVRQLFADYMKVNGHRKTPERFAILDAIYSIKGHFDVDELYYLVVEKGKFRVSTATMYNTLNLLVEAKLIIRHNFGDKMTHYEACYNMVPHHHLICMTCGAVTDFIYPELEETIHKMKTNRFQMDNYSLYVYGTCSKCSTSVRRKQIRINNKTK